jgi:hypothetical protein
MGRQHMAPLALGVAVVACVVVAAATGRPVWAAALGAGLVLAYWGLEVLSWRRGEASGSFGAAMGVALGGMMLRLAVVLSVLAAVGLLAGKAAFTTAAVAFLAAFTLYLPLRFVVYSALRGPGQTGARS